MNYELEITENINHILLIDPKEDINNILTNLEKQNSFENLRTYLETNCNCINFSKTKDIYFEVISTKPKELVSLTLKELRVICESLYNFTHSLEDVTVKSKVQELLIQNKLNEVDKIFKKIELASEYDFLKQLEKCKNNKDHDDIGEEAILIGSKKKEV